jgi:hypothetical protein
MSKHAQRWTLAGLLLVLCAWCGVAAAQAPSDELTRQVIVAINLDAAIQGFPDSIKSAAQQQRLTAPDVAAVDRVTKLMVGAVDAKRVTDSMAAVLKSEASAAELQTLLAWAKTPLGSAILAAERANQGPQRRDNESHFVAGLSANPPPAERIRLVQAVEAEASLTEQAARLAEEIMRTTVRMISAIRPGSAPSQEETDAMLAKFHASVMPMLRQQVMLDTLFDYRELSDEQLSQYVEFLRSDLGKRYMKLSVDSAAAGLRRFFEDGFIAIGKDVEQRAREKSA